MLPGPGLPAACAVGALVAAAGVLAMAFPGRPEPWPEHLPRRAAGMALWAAASVYSCSSEPAYGWMHGAGAVLAPSAALLAIGAGYATELGARGCTAVS